MNSGLGSLAIVVALGFFVAPRAAAQTGARFGHAVASADVNGDGLGDVIVGEPFHDGVFTDEGRVLVYYGSASGLASTPSWTKRGHQRGAHFGASLASAGDVNGDGFDDVVIGAPEIDTPPPPITGALRRASLAGSSVDRDQGAVFVFLGSASGLSQTPALVRAGVERNEHFGHAVNAAGDVDGDGFDDVIVGALGTGAGLGGAFLFRGSPLGPEPFPSWIVQGDVANSAFGFAVSGMGDFDGDGFDDVAVSAPDEYADVGAGFVYLYAGSASGLQTTPFWIQFDQGDFGWSLAAGGDLEGLGLGSLLIGMPDARAQVGGHSVIPVGQVVVLAGPTTFFFGWGLEGSIVEGARFGTSVSSAGDTNGNGIPEVVSGEPDTLFGGLTVDELSSTPHATTRLGARIGSQSAGEFGFSVASAGDVDGDGFDDIVASEPGWDGAAVDQGRVAVYRGSPTGIGANAAWTLVAP